METRTFEVGVTTPFVHVNTIEVGLDVVVTAGKVVCRWDSGVGVIVGRVTNRNISVPLVGDVCLHVSDGGLDEWSSVGVGRVGDDLVTGEESQHVIVLLHLVNDGGVSLVQLQVPLWTRSGDGEGWLRQIGDDVDVVFLEQLHASAVIGFGVQSVDTKNVCVELGQVWKISLTAALVGQWIDEGVVFLATDIGLVGDTPDVELGTVVRVKELVTNDINGWEAAAAVGRNDSRQSGKQASSLNECIEKHGACFLFFPSLTSKLLKC